MLNLQVLNRIAAEQNQDPIVLRSSAEAMATPQPHKCWGLTDRQSDVIAAMHRRGDIQAVVDITVAHYRKVNEGTPCP